jgi:phosphoglycerate dehydrogenase-like enzyme
MSFNVALTADFLTDGKLVYDDIGLSVLDRAGLPYQFFSNHEPVVSPEQMKGYNALICLTPKITADSLAQSSEWIAIARFGVGYDGVDVRACTEADVALFIAAGAVNHSVAEAIVGWMLALNHRVLRKDRLIREGKWAERSKWMGSELRGKRVGIIGLGGIGSTLVGLLQPFGVEVAAYDPYVDRGIRRVDLRELLSTSDYVVVTCPLTEQTRGMLGREQLALMKRSAYLINTARGGIVDEAALYELLRDRKIAGAAVDVFASEPVTSHPFFELDNVLLAPHSIAWTDELFEEIGTMCCRQLVTLSRGDIPPGLVNKEVLERPGFISKVGTRCSSSRSC